MMWWLGGSSTTLLVFSLCVEAKDSGLAVGSWVAYLSAPLKRQATKRPGRPGRFLNTSITKYNTICIKKHNENHIQYLLTLLKHAKCSPGH